jgi:hypothetical protein
LYILEEKRTIYFDLILGHHDNPLALQFSKNVQRTWAISKGLKPSDGNFEDFMKVEFVFQRCIIKQMARNASCCKLCHLCEEPRNTIFFIKIVGELHMPICL